MPHTRNEQSRHIACILRRVVDNGIGSFEATQEAEDRWVGIIKSKAHLGARFHAECTPGYYNNDGMGSNDTGFLSGQYGDGSAAFFRVQDEWRKATCWGWSSGPVDASGPPRVDTAHWLSQFSMRSDGTRANSRVLAVTRVRSAASAWAAISRSFGPIGVPCRVRWWRIFP